MLFENKTNEPFCEGEVLFKKVSLRFKSKNDAGRSLSLTRSAVGAKTIGRTKSSNRFQFFKEKNEPFVVVFRSDRISFKLSAAKRKKILRTKTESIDESFFPEKKLTKRFSIETFFCWSRIFDLTFRRRNDECEKSRRFSSF